MVRSDERQDSAICEFNSSGSSLAVATPDGLVKAFDTGEALDAAICIGSKGFNLPNKSLKWPAV